MGWGFYSQRNTRGFKWKYLGMTEYYTSRRNHTERLVGAAEGKLKDTVILSPYHKALVRITTH